MFSRVRSGFTLIELLVVVAIIALPFAVQQVRESLYPALANADDADLAW